MRIYLYLTLTYTAFACNPLLGQGLSPIVWCFGDSAEISFASGSPVSLPGCQLSCLEGTAIACDKTTGALLFYTDGTHVWNRNNTIMPGNTIPLGGNSSSTQSALLVPVPGQSQQCYLFALDDQAGYYNDGDSGLSYSIIDMSLNGGLGDVLQQPVELLTPTTEKLTSTPMADGKGFWVVTHQWNSDAFYTYPVTQSGVGIPVISHQGCVHAGIAVNYYNEAIGYMRISPDGSLLADAIAPTISKAELFRFDNTTGNITAQIFSDSGFAWGSLGWGPYGVSFSPNSKVLYVTEPRGDTIQNYLIQYDLTLPSGNEMIFKRDTFYTSGPYSGAAAIAPDGKIYIANASRHGGRVLDRINNPNVFGQGCNFEQGALTLTYGTMVLGLPNGINITPIITDSLAVVNNNSCADSCAAEIIVKPTSGYPPFAYQWLGTNQNDSIAANLCPGKYYVVITDQFGSSVTDSTVIAAPLNNEMVTGIIANGNLLQCTNTSVVQWYSNNMAVPGANNPIFMAPVPGSYVASGKDDNGCDFEDTIQVESANYFFPNAFTPNGDGINDTYFPALQPGAVLLAFKIFDRWGELVYEDVNQPWDGKYKGAEMLPGTYVYYAEVQANDLNNNGQIGIQKVRGSFVLLR